MNTCAPISVLLLLLMPAGSYTQSTTGRVCGTAADEYGRSLPGTGIMLTDTVSGFDYRAIAGRSGRYLLENIPPGDQYRLTATYSGYGTRIKQQVSVRLGETTIVDLQLFPSYERLEEVRVIGYRHQYPDAAGEIRLSPDWREKQPGKEWIHYFRNQPDIRTIPGNEDAISLGGQNNRYNAFYIDGAVLNDVFGLSASGTNGGTTGASPVSMECIDQILVSTTPYDASFGKFTGGTIQMTTRTGTKQFAASFYSNWSPGWLTGKLQGIEEPYTKGSEHITGIRASGRLIGNKWLYFLNRETQESVFPQAFNWQLYPGDMRDKTQPDILSKALQDRYGYDPGSYLNTPANLHAERFFFKIDGKPSYRSSFMLSFRYSSSRRDELANGNPGTIAYANHGYTSESSQQVVTAEWKSQTGASSGNRLLATYTRVSDRRMPAGQPFPELRIYDGDGSLILGSDNNAAFNQLEQQNVTLFDQWYWRCGKHILRAGFDAEFDRISNVFLQNSFGTYSYASVSAFLSGYSASGYEAGYVLSKGYSSREIPKAVHIQLLRTAFFIGDEYRLSGKMRIYFGLRFDKEQLFASIKAQPEPDPIFWEAVRDHWGVGAGVAGGLPRFSLRVAPRLQWWWQQKDGTLLTAGIGMFTGKMPLAWLAAPLLHNGVDIGGWKAGNRALGHIRFNQDAGQPWTPEQFGESLNNIPLDLSASRLQMPTILRSSACYTGKLSGNIRFTLKGSYSLTLAAINYTNINLLPPEAHLSGPDTRVAYSYTQSMHIPVSRASGNPYEAVIYLHNQDLKKGYAYDGTIQLNGSVGTTTEWEAAYSYGRSVSIHDGAASLPYSNWRFTETTGGRNHPLPTVSDYSPGHHLTFRYILSLPGKHSKKSWLLSITYNGQSGMLFSYTYHGLSLQKEDEATGYYELMYVPGPAEISRMHFLPFAGKLAYYPEQLQRQLLELYLRQNSYFNENRGKYVTRNSSKTPWVNTVDLQIRKNWRLKWEKTYLLIESSLECYNVLNLINPGWGIHYRVPFDNSAIMEVAGFADADGLVPVYRFNPEKASSPPWLPVSGRKSAYRSEWSCQLSFRLTI